ncbi:unnamed protein product [Ectocarpus sp. 8 AP-2014]
MVELGADASALDVYQPPKAYKVADHLRTCPPVERMTLPLYPQERLSPLQIAHFAACLSPWCVALVFHSSMCFKPPQCAILVVLVV